LARGSRKEVAPGPDTRTNLDEVDSHFFANLSPRRIRVRLSGAESSARSEPNDSAGLRIGPAEEQDSMTGSDQEDSRSGARTWSHALQAISLQEADDSRFVTEVTSCPIVLIDELGRTSSVSAWPTPDSTRSSAPNKDGIAIRVPPTMEREQAVLPDPRWCLAVDDTLVRLGFDSYWSHGRDRRVHLKQW
jgi:hypothetical protein